MTLYRMLCDRCGCTFLGRSHAEYLAKFESHRCHPSAKCVREPRPAAVPAK